MVGGGGRGTEHPSFYSREGSGWGDIFLGEGAFVFCGFWLQVGGLGPFGALQEISFF